MSLMLDEYGEVCKNQLNVNLDKVYLSLIRNKRSKKFSQDWWLEELSIQLYLEKKETSRTYGFFGLIIGMFVMFCFMA